MTNLIFFKIIIIIIIIIIIKNSDMHMIYDTLDTRMHRIIMGSAMSDSQSFSFRYKFISSR